MLVVLDAAGVERAIEALRTGRAVVVPFASPLPYAVVGTRSAVNRAKGRPLDQPCGVLVAAFGALAGALDLDAEAFALAAWIAEIAQVNTLVPVAAAAPDWVRAEAADGRLGITVACLAQVRPLIQSLGHLSTSSANRSGEPVALTAEAADRCFDGRLLVLDGDPWRSGAGDQGSATIVEVGRGGELRVLRDGVNNRDFLGEDAPYLDELRRRAAAAVDGPPCT